MNFDLYKPKIQAAQFPDFILFPFLSFCEMLFLHQNKFCNTII